MILESLKIYLKMLGKSISIVTQKLGPKLSQIRISVCKLLAFFFATLNILNAIPSLEVFIS